MSALLAGLLAMLDRFDDDAFAALANKGLLRRARKDLEKDGVGVAAQTDDAVTVTVGEHRVVFDATGPVGARCTCPATKVCQHVLAAAIGLRDLPRDAVDGATPADPAPDLPTALLAIAPAELLTHAGTQGYRWAYETVHDLALERDLEISVGDHVALAIARPRVRAHYAGGGIDSLVLDLDRGSKQVERYRVLCVLAFWRAHGQELPLPKPRKPRAAGLDLGEGFTPATPTAIAQLDSGRRLREAARALLVECVQLGLAHLSQGVQERFTTLSVWAQGAEHHRLARLLRRLADHVEMLLLRRGGADEHRLLDEMSLCLGLIEALTHTDREGRSSEALMGRARRTYEDAGQLDLLGLGAFAWRTGAGFHGLTMLFWDSVHRRFVAATDARPETMRGFDPRARAKAPGPWPGLGAPILATGRRLVLQNARTNDLDQISTTEKTTATVADAGSGEVHGALEPVSRWADAERTLLAARESLLAERQPMADWFALQPERFGDPSFDEPRQTLVWPITDVDGADLVLELPWSELHAHAIDRIEGMRARDLSSGTLVVARLRVGAQGLIGEPLSLVFERQRKGPAVDALHFDGPPRAARRGKGRSRKDPAPAAAEASPRHLLELRQFLRECAERGIPRRHLGPLRQKLRARSRAARDIGLDLLTEPADTASADTLATHLLVDNYRCLQAHHLIAR